MVTSMFVHGGLFHFAGNLLYLWIFGDNIEDRLGHGRFLIFYLASAAAWRPAQTGHGPGLRSRWSAPAAPSPV
jgi:hypothetical protein